MSDIVERLKKLADDNYEMLGNIHVPLLEAAAATNGGGVSGG